MSYRSVLRTIRTRATVFLVAVIGGIALSGLALALTTEVYDSSVVIYISAQPGADSTTNAYQGELLSAQRITSYSELIGGRRVAEDASRAVGGSVPPEVIMREVSASSVPGSTLLTATVRDSDPTRAAEIANAVGGSLEALVRDLERSDDPRRQPAVTARVVEPAYPSTQPASPDSVAYLTVGAVLGIVVGIGLVFLLESFDQSVKSREKLGDLVSAPALDSIVEDQVSASGQLVVRDAPTSAGAECYRKLRTAYQFLYVDRSDRATMVTSSLPGEGKTIVSCNLALALADAGLNVVILEADLRRPRAGEYLGLDSSVGITSVLSGRLTLGDATQNAGHDRLSFIGSGLKPPNPSELLGSKQMRDLMTELRMRYDAVIVDAAPVVPVTDAVALSQWCDGSIFVTRFGKTKSATVREALQGLTLNSNRILGCVLTFAPSSESKSNYGYAVEYQGSHSAASENVGRGVGLDPATENIDRSRPRVESRPSPGPRGGIQR